MSSTTICYKDAAFVAEDVPIEVLLFEVSRQISLDTNIDTWLAEMRDEWRLQATAGFGFGPSPALDHFLTTDERRERLASYLRKTLQALFQKGDTITAEELSRSGIGGQEAIYTRSVPTQAVIDVGEQFVALIS